MNIGHLDISDFIIDNNVLFDVQKNIDYNDTVLKFYKKLLFNSRVVSSPTYREKVKSYDKYDKDSIDWGYSERIVTMENKISNMMNCNSLWHLNVYEQQKLKVLVKTNLCKDRFCNNCKKVKQALRMQRFIPKIKEISQTVNTFHLVLTIPSIDGIDLRKNVDIMKNAFSKFINYLNPKKKKDTISGIDFGKFNYEGALRSLEVTYNKKGFHPHYHVLLAMDYKIGEKINNNVFGKKFGKIVRLFSDEEILFQKLWFLLIQQETVRFGWLRKISNTDDVKKQDKLMNEMNRELRKYSITKKKLDQLDLGYSVMLDEFADDDYFELFKYMTKAKMDDEEVFNYDSFVHLYFQLKGVRQIQGYGCFFRFTDEGLEDDIDTIFSTFISIIESHELPYVLTQKTKELALDYEYKHLSRNKAYSKYLSEIENFDRKKELDIMSS